MIRMQGGLTSHKPDLYLPALTVRSLHLVAHDCDFLTLRKDFTGHAHLLYMQRLSCYDWNPSSSRGELWISSTRYNNVRTNIIEAKVAQY